MSFDMFKNLFSGSGDQTSGQAMTTAANEASPGAGMAGGLDRSSDYATRLVDTNMTQNAMPQAAESRGFFGGFRDFSQSPLGQLTLKNLKFGGVPIKTPKGQGSILKKSKVSLGYKGGPALEEGDSIKLDAAMFNKMVDNIEKGLKTKAEKEQVDYTAEQPLTWSDSVRQAYEEPQYEAPPDTRPEFDPNDENWDEFLQKYYF